MSNRNYYVSLFAIVLVIIYSCSKTNVHTASIYHSNSDLESSTEVEVNAIETDSIIPEPYLRKDKFGIVNQTSTTQTVYFYHGRWSKDSKIIPNQRKIYLKEKYQTLRSQHPNVNCHGCQVSIIGGKLYELYYQDNMLKIREK